MKFDDILGSLYTHGLQRGKGFWKRLDKSFVQLRLLVAEPPALFSCIAHLCVVCLTGTPEKGALEELRQNCGCTIQRNCLMEGLRMHRWLMGRIEAGPDIRTLDMSVITFEGQITGGRTWLPSSRPPGEVEGILEEGVPVIGKTFCRQVNCRIQVAHSYIRSKRM